MATKLAYKPANIKYKRYNVWLQMKSKIAADRVLKRFSRKIRKEDASKAGGITISSAALAKYLSRRSSSPPTKRSTTAAKLNHVPQPHGQVKTGTKEPEHRESATGPK